MKGITAKQKGILDFIDEWIRKHNRPPSYGEIAMTFGFTRASSRNYLEALLAKGYITPNANKRGRRLDIQLTDQGRAILCGNG